VCVVAALGAVWLKIAHGESDIMNLLLFSDRTVVNPLIERTNRLRDAMSVEEIRERYSEEDLLFLGDKSPLYRYVVERQKCTQDQASNLNL
jgi:hypothetical protein